MRPSSTAKRYADAAYEVARAEGAGAVEGWLKDLSTAVETLEDPGISRYLRDPSVGRDEKLDAVGKLFHSARPHVLNLLRLLVVRNRVSLLPGILTEMQRLDREARGIAEAWVTVARPLDQSERQDIAQRLGRALGRDVELHTRVDHSILGGIVVRIGDRLMDASIAGRLERLRHELAV